MAKALLAQGAQQNANPAGQMVSGRYVPNSFFQNLQGPVNQMLGAYMANKGDEKALALAEQIRKGREAEKQAAVQLIKENKPVDILNLANDYGGVTPFISAATKVALPEPTTLEREWKAAVAQGYKGTINQFKNQMNDAERARIGLQAQEQRWNMGLPIGGVGVGGGAPQAPLQTINPGSPILAPNQVGMPQQGQAPMLSQGQMPQGQMPVFRSKPEQELWLSKQKKIGDLQAEALNALPGAQLKVETALGAINNMIGDTTVDAKGNLVLGKNKPHAGFYEAVGMPSPTNLFGITGMFPGSDVQDFKTEFGKVGGAAFLQAVETLRGTGAISETEGKKATDAVTSMSLAQSEKAFVKAANEFRDAINKGYIASQQKAGVKPFNPTATPNVGGAQPKLKYNLQTGQWE